ncbi:UvrD-helicase domain-containing protein [Amycolatopsis sp. NPDC058340]|uniref:UvrD-helicase domain-containing protein n=1 Tax=Amycolatopsis sp. NPDC058340 TaxID=3346453 RepID=UPI00365DF463
MSGQAAAAVTLRMLDKADKEIEKMDRSTKGAIYDFLKKFRRDPATHGLRFKRLSGSPLFSARVTKDYRAIISHIRDSEWLLLTVAHRGESYENLEMLERLANEFAYSVNPVTGGIEFVDIVAVESSIGIQRSKVPRPTVDHPLFSSCTPAQLIELGVAEALVPIVVKLTSEEELLGLAEYAPSLTGEILLALYDGMSIDDVRKNIVAPQAVEDAVDPDDFASALDRPATQVTTDDKALETALQGDFPHWKIFLHPTQRKLVTRDYSGPARVSGGPGTGKTVVALHRVCHLAAQLPPGDDRPILFTTFTRNLAEDLRRKLMDLGGPEVAQRVDVVNISKLARRVVDATDTFARRNVITDQQALAEWRALVAETGTTGWDADFLAEEWSQVILGQALNSFSEYAQVRRAGRGRRLTRADRKDVWQLAEQFGKRLDDRNWTTHNATAAYAARLEAERAARLRAGASGDFRYRHVVVDEAQDLHGAHWKMLRSMVPEDRNDIFCAGDTHQRIYDNVVSLGSLGVNIRGRSSKLTLNYRTSRQILSSAMAIMKGQSYDDLDGGIDGLDGYRSVLDGPVPSFQGFATEAAELDAVVARLGEWSVVSRMEDLAVCVPTRDLVARLSIMLADAGISSVELTSDGPKGTEGVSIGTMHRFKGLEFQRIVIAGAAEGLLPRTSVDRMRTADPARFQRQIQRDRSLLFVAATRARDQLAVFWHGSPSRFLTTLSKDPA